MMTHEELTTILQQMADCAYHRANSLEILAHNQAQRAVIAEQQQRIDELIARKNDFHRDAVEWRGVEFENVCTECSGSGYKVYGNTTTYHHGAGGQAITTSVCNKCWGSGDKLKPWTSWLKIEQQAKEIEKLTGAISHWTLERYYQLEQENKTLREALQDVTKGFAACMAVAGNSEWAIKERLKKAQQALKEVP